MPTLAQIKIAARNGMVLDEVTNTLAFDMDATVVANQTAIQNAIAGFYKGTNPTFPLSAYLAWSVDWTNMTTELYDLTGHLDGTPHGSPVATFAWDGSVGTPAQAQGFGNQLAAVVAFHAAYDVAERGPQVPLPSTDEAIDQGAPATHLGYTRPRARERGRLYFGPISSRAFDGSTNGMPKLTASFTADAANAAKLLQAAPVSWSVWSRRDSQLRHVTSGWIDSRVASSRRREYAPNVKVLWP